MTFIISYLIALVLLVFNFICFVPKNHFTVVCRIFLFFIPLVNIVTELAILGYKVTDLATDTGWYTLRNNKFTHWMFNDAHESLFTKK